MTATADQVLEKIGSFGRYQWLLLIFANVLVFFWYGWPMLIITFIAAEPGWRCVKNNSACNVSRTVQPWDDNFDDRCNMSRDAWTFDAEYTSVVTEFDLVCDKALYGTVSSSLVFLGSLMGSAAFSIFSDKFGRRIVIYVSGFLVALFGLLSAFPNVYWLYAIFRFIVGFGLGGGVSIFILISEFVGVRHRSIMGTSLWYCWTLSLMVLAGMAYLITDWRMLCIATGAPAIPLVIGYWFTPESLRWLIVKGKNDEALKLCNKVAKFNGKQISDGEMKLEVDEKDSQRLGDVRDLFGSLQMAKKTLIVLYCWFANALVYYGVYLSTPTVGGDMYLNFFLASVIEIPAIPAGIWIYNRFGRKKGVIIPMLLAAAGAAGSVLLTTDDESNKGYLAGKIVMSMIWAKFWIMISYDGFYVYSAELFPTVVRNIGMGASEAAAAIGSFCSPYIVYLQRIHPLLPYGIMGLNALIAGLLCILLPETRYQPTLETTKEQQETGKDMEATVLPAE